MDELSHADINQQYLNNLVSYKGHIVYLTRVFDDKRVKVYYLETRLSETVQFKLEDFSVIKRRLGMVNVCDAVVYVARLPVRKMGIGINKNNITIASLPIKYPFGKDATIYAINSLVSEGIYQTLTNTYLPFEAALDLVHKERPTTVAFDRQFAIDSDRVIYYKTTAVGALQRGGISVSNIVFNTEYKHLSILLESNHEKTIGHPCSY